VIFDLQAGTSAELDTHEPPVGGRLDATGEVVVTVLHWLASPERTASDGTFFEVGSAGNGPVHLVGGREVSSAFAVSPDAKWIASVSGRGGTAIRLWPMPDLDKPPLHTLPREELIAKLETLTNLRALRDETSSTGWSIEIGPFPGWETVPSW